MGRDFGFSKDVASDGEALSLVFREVLGDQLARGTSEIIDAIGDVLANLYLAIWVSDPIHHASRHSDLR